MKTRSQTVPPKADDLLRHALEVGDLRLERAVRRWKRLRRKAHLKWGIPQGYPFRMERRVGVVSV